MGWLENLFVKGIVSVILLAAIAPIVVRFFRDTWKQLDREATSYRKMLADKIDARAAVTLLVGPFALALISYYGNQEAYEQLVQPTLRRLAAEHPSVFPNFDQWSVMYWRGWW